MSRLMEPYRLNPWREFQKLQSTLDRLFEEERRTNNTFDFAPRCEVAEDGTQFALKVDLPGVKKENIKIEINENVLTLSGERKTESQSNDKNVHVSEISYGSFVRTFTLPSTVDAEKVVASYEEGVLSLTLPKTELQKARVISIK